jgi:tRNA A37 threonylcarbamoyltransferase TsaD
MLPTTKHAKPIYFNLKFTDGTTIHKNAQNLLEHGYFLFSNISIAAKLVFSYAGLSTRFANAQNPAEREI